MKYTSKYNAGFTLIELVVAMAIAVVVTAAASSVLLMGLRINRQTGDTASQQMTVRTLLSVVEKAAADGSIQDVITDYESWQLVDAAIDEDEEKPSYRVIFGFDSETQRIYIGKVVETGVVTNEGTTVLEGVYASNVIIEGKLLSVSVETKEGIFASSVYCRTTKLDDESGSNGLPGEITGQMGRDNFIQILKSQYRSRGEIVGADSNSLYQYYSEWYISTDYDAPGYAGNWNSKTPWCACFVSWALDQIGMHGPAGYCPDNRSDHNHGNWFADVDEFMAYFQDATRTESAWQVSASHGGTYTPIAGDMIFFDWNKGEDPSHVGVVLSVKQEGNRTTVYTIEGNSAGRVNIRSYSLTDPRIIGYGVLWPSDH